MVADSQCLHNSLRGQMPPWAKWNEQPRPNSIHWIALATHVQEIVVYSGHSSTERVVRPKLVKHGQGGGSEGCHIWKLPCPRTSSQPTLETISLHSLLCLSLSPPACHANIYFYRRRRRAKLSEVWSCVTECSVISRPRPSHASSFRYRFEAFLHIYFLPVMKPCRLIKGSWINHSIIQGEVGGISKLLPSGLDNSEFLCCTPCVGPMGLSL